MMLQALVGYQDLSYDSTRAVAGMTALGSTNGSEFFAAMDAECRMNYGGFSFGPVASLECHDISVDGFTETRAGIWNLSVGDLSGDI